MTAKNQDRTEIKAVFFDIGNVLLKFDAYAIARKIACAVSRHPLRVAKYLWSSRIGEAVERGEVSSHDLFRLFQTELDFKGGPDEFRRLWCDHFTLDRGTSELLKKLTHSHKVYLLSNTNHMHYEFIRERYEFPQWVDGAVLSYKLGLRKPEPAIYWAALKRARVEPPESVFIDDLRENVVAARKLGIQALRYKGLDVLKRDLAKLGVLG